MIFDRVTFVAHPSHRCITHLRTFVYPFILFPSFLLHRFVLLLGLLPLLGHSADARRSFSRRLRRPCTASRDPSPALSCSPFRFTPAMPPSRFDRYRGVCVSVRACLCSAFLAHSVSSLLYFLNSRRGDEGSRRCACIWGPSRLGHDAPRDVRVMALVTGAAPSPEPCNHEPLEPTTIRDTEYRGRCRSGRVTPPLEE